MVRLIILELAHLNNRLNKNSVLVWEIKFTGKYFCILCNTKLKKYIYCNFNLDINGVRMIF